jgi:hypothetical protein
VSVFHVDAVGRHVLRDDENLLHSRLDQPLGFTKDVRSRPRNEIATQFRNDAERAAIAAAFGDLQISVMARRELDPFRRDQIEKSVVRRIDRAMNGVENSFILLRAGDGENTWISGSDPFRLRAHAAGHDDFPVLRQCFSDRGERLFLCGLEKPASVDDRDIRAFMVSRERISFSPQPADDALAIDEGFWASERDEAHLRRGWRIHQEIPASIRPQEVMAARPNCNKGFS